MISVGISRASATGVSTTEPSGWCTRMDSISTCWLALAKLKEMTLSVLTAASVCTRMTTV